MFDTDFDQQPAYTALVNHLNEILSAARPRLSRLAGRYGVTSDAADDVVQETLMEAWRHLDNLRNPERFDAWLDGICRNVCLRWTHTQGKTLQVAQSMFFLSDGIEDIWQSDIADPLALDPFEELDRQELSVLLDRALGYLPGTTREALEMCYLEELPQREVALRLGLTIKALEVRLVRARRQLRQVLSTELRTEAEDFGLALDQKAATGWHQTRIWCMFCARTYLQGLLEPLPDDHVNLRMRCPTCNHEWIKSGGMRELRGLKSFRPALKRVQQVATEHWASMPHRQACPYCREPVKVRLLRSGESLPWLTPWQGLRFTMECSSCDAHNSYYVGSAIWLHPLAEQFMTRHPRWINEPESLVEYAGQPAFRVCLTDITCAARLIMLLHVQTMQVLAIHHE
jgi:RNA polymerase sigma factor (sigma-70 family)